mmetsp:Transcript_7271/g.30920  ORF Transcript_7271/g.30920 Transcript_7271/m.30920 type:complete len:556 (+) Transcript_7271:17-1684(+)
MAHEDVDIDQLLQRAEYRDFYSLLGISREASPEDIKRQYYKLVKTFHPDKQGDEQKKVQANEMFAALTQAFEILSDPERRQVYDEYGIEGIISGWELSKTMGEENAWEKVLNLGKKKKAQEAAAQSSSGLEVHFDASTLYDKWWLNKEEPYQGLELSCVAINHSVKVPTSEQGKLVLTASTATSPSGLLPGGRAATYGQVAYHHNISHSTLAIAQIASNTRNHTATTMLVKRLNEHNTGILQASYSAAGMGLSLSLDTDLSEAWSTCITLAAGAHNNSVTFKTSRKITDSSECSVSITTGDRMSYAEFEAWKKITDSVAVNLGVSTEGRCTVGASNTVTTNTSVGFDVGMDLRGGISLELCMSYFKHKLKVPVIMANEMSGVAALTAIAFPIAFYSLFRLLVVNPIASIAAARELKELRAKQAVLTEQNRKRAARDVSLMKETVERKINSELRVRGGGLVIVSATYGNLKAKKSGGKKLSDSVIPVTVALQFQVEDSKLELPGGESKCSLLGFYDPCIGDDKWLHVVYRFQGKLHEVTIGDTQSLRIPQRSHLRR